MKASLGWIRDFLGSELPEVAERLSSIGLAVDGVEEIDGDSIYELDVTANRGDCLSHLGVARELAAVYGLELRLPETTIEEGEAPVDRLADVEIASTDLCARYAARYISGVAIGPSPNWLVERLARVGIRAINNVADVTNYVLMELGHPLHAFDADTLEERRIVVRRANPGEMLTTLDGIERKLASTMLVIADAARPVAMAGIMGGLDTEISATTTNVLLESAWFDPASVRGTAKHINLGTEASYRFERGADVMMVPIALDRAAHLIAKVAGGVVARGVIDRHRVLPKAPVMKLTQSKLTARLGTAVPAGDVLRILKGLAFDPSEEEGVWTVHVPSHRHDIKREEDLIEEVARHYGYDRFPATLPRFAGQGRHLPRFEEEGRIRRTLSAIGYTETCTIAFGRQEDAEAFAPDRTPVALRNPLSQDAPVMRVSLLPGLLETARHNLNRGTRDLAVYEMSKIYPVTGEIEQLAMLMTGSAFAPTVHRENQPADFFTLKGDVEAVLAGFRCDTTPSTDGVPGYLHPGRSIRLGEAAVLGELNDTVTASHKIRQKLYVAEIAVDKLLSAGLLPIASRRIPKFPSVRRDLSLLIRKDSTYGDVVSAVRGASIQELIDVFPFDKLEKGAFPADRYSLAIALTFQADDRTLTDAEVEDFERRVLGELERLGIELRS